MEKRSSVFSRVFLGQRWKPEALARNWEQYYGKPFFRECVAQGGAQSPAPFKNYFYRLGELVTDGQYSTPSIAWIQRDVKLDLYLVRLYTSKLTTDCLDVCEQSIAREFEAGYCLRSGERTGVVDATSPSPR